MQVEVAIRRLLTRSGMTLHTGRRCARDFVRALRTLVDGVVGVSPDGLTLHLTAPLAGCVVQPAGPPGPLLRS